MFEVTTVVVCGGPCYEDELDNFEEDFTDYVGTNIIDSVDDIEIIETIEDVTEIIFDFDFDDWHPNPDDQDQTQAPTVSPTTINAFNFNMNRVVNALAYALAATMFMAIGATLSYLFMFFKHVVRAFPLVVQTPPDIPQDI